MGTALTLGNLTGHLSRFDRLRGRYQGAVDRAHGLANTAVRTAVVGGTAYGISALQARYGGVTFMKLPLDLAVGLAAHAVALAGVGRDTAQHLHNMGDGALAVWAASKGAQQGLKWRQAKGLGAPAAEPRKIAPGLYVHGDTGGMSAADVDLAHYAHYR